jgi:hypothetical protein
MLVVLPRTIEGWQWFLIWLSPFIGAGIGGLVGWWKKDQPWNWKLQVVTLADGLVAGLIWLLLFKWMSAEWGAAAMGAGLLIGIGFDFLVKKYPAPK